MAEESDAWKALSDAGSDLEAKITERFGGVNMPLGGKHGYVSVRKVRKERFQGYTPKKRPGHTTKDYTTAHGAAVALALLKEDIRCGVVDSAKAKRAWHGSSASAPALPNALPSLAPVFLLTARCGAGSATRTPSTSGTAFARMKNAIDLVPLCKDVQPPLCGPVAAHPLMRAQAALLLARKRLSIFES